MSNAVVHGHGDSLDRAPYIAIQDYLESLQLNMEFRSIYKRARYRRHIDNLEALEDVFEILQRDDTPRGLFVILSKTLGISQSTLSTWRARVRKDPSWRPKRSNYGKHKLVFSLEEEEQLVQYMHENYIHNGLFYSDRDFYYDAIRYHNFLTEEKAKQIQTGASADLTIRNFKCSPKFIIDFRKRWNMALRRSNLKRRPKATPEQKSL